ncbi:MAG: Eco29kI family restriction endonuclease [Rubrobacteraceae bacterium]
MSRFFRRSRRCNSQKPPWDMVHPGRPWAERMRDNNKSREQILDALDSRLSDAERQKTNPAAKTSVDDNHSQ